MVIRETLEIVSNLDQTPGEASVVGEAEGLRLGVKERAIKQVEMSGFPDSGEFLAFVDILSGMVPAQFYKVFLLSQKLESLMGERLKPLVERGGERSVEQQDRGVPIVKNPFRVVPADRAAEGVADLALMEPSELLAGGFVETVRRAVFGEIEVCDLEPENGDKSSAISAIPEGKGERLNAYEQDLYLLIDLSYSMRNNNRLVLAQTLALWYLAQKYFKQGARPRVHLRGYAIDVGPLVTAQELGDLAGVVNEILAADARQKGTDTPLALKTVAEDIRFHCFSGAEVLLITDGLCKVNADEINELFEGLSKVHTVKIGDDLLLPTEAELRDIKARAVVSDTEACANLNREVEGQWAAISENLIKVPDVEEVGLDEEGIGMLENLVKTKICAQEFNAASILIKRQAVFVNDLLGQVLKEKLAGEVHRRAESLQEELVAWLAPGVEVDIVAELVADGKQKSPSSLQLGRHKVGVGLRLFKRLSNGPRVFVNTLEALIKFVIALTKRAFGR